MPLDLPILLLAVAAFLGSVLWRHLHPDDQVDGDAPGPELAG